METGKQVQILLSTYNGEKYLREQLDSYAKLSNLDEVAILIRDDGSTDLTPDILREYADKDNFRVEFGDHVGTNGSYQWLLQNSDPACAYFAFSDQDDVWLCDKLKQAMDALSRHPQDIPLLFASRSQIVDEKLRPIGWSSLPVRGVSFYNAMVQNVLPGHTQVFNKALRDDLSQHGIMGAHVVDWWVYLVAAAKGHVIFSEESFVLHRQHGKNAVGYRVGALSGFKKKLDYIRAGKGNAISRQLLAFLQAYEEELSPAYREELQRYLDGAKSFWGHIAYLRRCKIYRQKPMEDMAFRTLYLLGKYDV